MACKVSIENHVTKGAKPIKQDKQDMKTKPKTQDKPRGLNQD